MNFGRLLACTILATVLCGCGGDYPLPPGHQAISYHSSQDNEALQAALTDRGIPFVTFDYEGAEQIAFANVDAAAVENVRRELFNLPPDNYEGYCPGEPERLLKLEALLRENGIETLVIKPNGMSIDCIYWPVSSDQKVQELDPIYKAILEADGPKRKSNITMESDA